MRSSKEKLDALLKKYDILTNELEKTSDLLSETILSGKYSEGKNFLIDPGETNKPSEKLKNYTKNTDEKRQRQTTKQIFEIAKKYPSKHGLNALITGILVVFAMTFLDFYANSETNPVEIKTKYVIENLRGDTLDTWKSWRIVEGSTMHVNLVNSEAISNKTMDITVNAITSEDSVEIDDPVTYRGPTGFKSTYFMGWAGALKDAANADTKYQIPTDFNIITSNGEEGDIIITLSNLKDSDGYSGYTKSVVDDNEILKSFITIYDVSNLPDEQLATILRHEFGHALGLGHSTAREDLMAPKPDKAMCYISECNIDAIIFLYDGGASDKVVCKK